MSDEFLRNIITEKRRIYTALARKEPGIEKPKPSILDLIIENVVETDAMTDKEIVADMIALFVGFYDAVLGIFSFITLMLAMHPESQKKVRDEVMSVLGIDDDVVEGNIKKLRYTSMVIKEALRMFPVGPLLAREVTDDLQIDKYTLPKGATVAMLPLLTHRLKEHWDEPDKFIPERFLPENCKDRHPFAYVPFSGGSRTCPASKFGTSCLKVMVAHFIRNYQLRTKMKLENLRLTTHISIRSLDGFKVSISKIEQTRL
nr:cytochrome P450 4AV17 [Meteorus pulchricornis]